MRRFHRHWYSLSWSGFVFFLAVAGATVCAGHPAAHDVAHSPLCTDSSSPAVQGDNKPILFVDGGTFPLPPDSMRSVVPAAAMTTHLPLALGLSTRQRLRMQQSLSPAMPRNLLPIFQL